MRPRSLAMLVVSAWAMIFSACSGEVVRPQPAVELTVVWKVPRGEGSSVDRYLAAQGSRLYSPFQGVTSHDLVSGAVVWHTGGVTSARNVVTVGERIIHAGSVARALDAASGQEIWRFEPDAQAGLGRTTADDATFYFGSAGPTIYALVAEDGELRWATRPLEEVQTSARAEALLVHGDTLYATIIDDASPTGHLKRGWVVALDRHTGEVLWRYVNGRAGYSHDATNPAVAGRLLLLNDRLGGAFFAIDRFTGEEIWRRVGPANRYGAQDDAKVVDGVAYLASMDTHVYAFDPETGHIHWRRNMRGSTYSSAVCGDYLFVSRGSLHALRRSDGAEVANLFVDEWGYVQPDEFVSSRLLAHEGRVYFIGYQNVYAVSCEL